MVCCVHQVQCNDDFLVMFAHGLFLFIQGICMMILVLQVVHLPNIKVRSSRTYDALV